MIARIIVAMLTPVIVAIGIAFEVVATPYWQFATWRAQHVWRWFAIKCMMLFGVFAALALYVAIMAIDFDSTARWLFGTCVALALAFGIPGVYVSIREAYN